MAHLLTLLLYLSLLSTTLFAKDLGVNGHLFAIEEEDLLVYLQNKFSSTPLPESAIIEFREQSTKSLRQPKGLGLPKAAASRSFTYDPKIMVHEDIKDASGKVIVAKGTTYNPLSNHSLTSPLLFFDGRDESQLEWAKSEIGLWILTDGAPLEIEEKESNPTYFDQNGFLTQKLGIQAIPAKVTQEGDHLKIEEIILKGRIS
jgi:conjugal transfer pilus assembly protein TraW